MEKVFHSFLRSNRNSDRSVQRSGEYTNIFPSLMFKEQKDITITYIMQALFFYSPKIGPVDPLGININFSKIIGFIPVILER